jgi:uncharacterized membrane protein (DUF2068 family)
MKTIHLAQLREELLADPAVKAEYDRLAEEYAEVRASVAALAEAKEKGMKPLSALLAELNASSRTLDVASMALVYFAIFAVSAYGTHLLLRWLLP